MPGQALAGGAILAATAASNFLCRLFRAGLERLVAQGELHGFARGFDC